MEVAAEKLTEGMEWIKDCLQKMKLRSTCRVVVFFEAEDKPLEG